jgi:hypothetical protein
MERQTEIPSGTNTPSQPLEHSKENINQFCECDIIFDQNEDENPSRLYKGKRRPEEPERHARKRTKNETGVPPQYNNKQEMMPIMPPTQMNSSYCLSVSSTTNSQAVPFQSQEVDINTEANPTKKRRNPKNNLSCIGDSDDLLAKYVGRSLEELQDKIPREDYIKLAVQRFLRESPYQKNPLNCVLRKEIMPIDVKDEYTDAVAMMLYAFGDVPKPKEEVIKLMIIESRRFVKNLFQKLSAIVNTIMSKNSSMSLVNDAVSDEEDFDEERDFAASLTPSSPQKNVIQTDTTYSDTATINPNKASENYSKRKVTLDVLAEALFPDIESIRFIEYVVLFLRKNKKLKSASAQQQSNPFSNEHMKVIEEDESVVTELIQEDSELEEAILNIPNASLITQNQSDSNSNKDDENDVAQKLTREEILDTDMRDVWHPNIESLIQKHNYNNPEIIKRYREVTIENIRKERLQRLFERDERAKKLKYDEYLFFSQCCRISFAKPRHQFTKWLNKQCHLEEMELKLDTDVQDAIAYLLYRHLERLVKEARRKKPEGIPLEPNDIQVCLQKQTMTQ